MNVSSRIRRWPGWLRWGLLLPGALAGTLLLYVSGRSLQYLSAEKDPGIFVPAKANVVVRARALETHWRRIRETGAWRTIRRRVLRNPLVKGILEGVLKDLGLPPLEDWEDARRPDWPGRLSRIAGRDAVAALRVGEAGSRVPWCAAVRLRWSDYLLLPLASWFLPSVEVAGRSCLKVRAGGREMFLSFQGAVAVAGSDPGILGEALRASGERDRPGRPVSWRVEFEGSRVLESLRRNLGEAGLFPFLRTDTVRAMTGEADVEGAEVRVDVFLEGAVPAGPGPPMGLVDLVPEYASGFLSGGAGAQELYQWLRRRGASSPDLQEVVRALEEAGFSSGVLSRLGSGVGMIMGVDERDGKLFPAMVLVFPSSDPGGAVEAMNAVIQSPWLAGKQAEARLERRRAGEGEMMVWRWPEGVMLGPVRFNDVLQLSYAAIEDAVVLGNTAAFTEAVVERGAGRGRGLFSGGLGRRVWERAGGPGEGGAGAWAVIFPGRLRESVDGILGAWAALEVYGDKDGARRRAEIEEDLRRQGGSASPEEIVRRFNEAVERSRRDREDALRRNLLGLDAVEWVVVRVEPSGEGVGIRLTVAFR